MTANEGNTDKDNKHKHVVYLIRTYVDLNYKKQFKKHHWI